MEAQPWELPDEEIVRNAISGTLYVRKAEALKAYERILASRDDTHRSG